MTREDVPLQVALVTGRPVRWAPPARTVGDYDGRERTLDVFMTDAQDQLKLLRTLRALQPEMDAAVGGPVVVIFHTVAETVRLYSEMVPQK